ncbi:MAG: sigma-70 family RNA polymerase sigma factor [Actinomycetota bacterium]
MTKKNDRVPEPDDRSLLAGIAKGDQLAFEMLYDRYSAAAFGVAWKICGSRSIAEDAVQEAFLSVWRRPGSFNPEKGSVAGYLFGAVHHKAVDAVRHEESVRRRELAASVEQDEDSGEEPVENAWLALRRDRVRSALDTLSDVQREALELAYFGGLTYREVAEKLGIPLGTAKTRLRDGIMRLRGVMSPAEVGEQA